MRPSDPMLAGLVDDAALFPPGNAPMPVALAEHARYRAAPWSAAIGPFLCPASRIDELAALLPGDQDIRVAVVNDVTGAAALHARGTAVRLSALAWLETRHDRLGEDPAAVSGAPLAWSSGLHARKWCWSWRTSSATRSSATSCGAPSWERWGWLS